MADVSVPDDASLSAVQQSFIQGAETGDSSYAVEKLGHVHAHVSM